MSLSSRAEEALQTFCEQHSWEARARLLMQWGEQLPSLTEQQRSEANQVHGCASLVWLDALTIDGHWQLRAWSDARLLRGLIALLLIRVEGLRAEQIAQVDLTQWFTELGLQRQLSPSRSNGLNAVMLRVQQLINSRTH